MEPTGRLWPNGEFTVGYAPCGGMEVLESAEEYAAKWTPPLGSSIPSNSHRHRDGGAAKRGTKGLTSHGKRVLRNAAWRMQRLYGKRSLSFVTLTLPSLSYEEYWNLSTCWSEVVRVFFQKISRALDRKGLPSCYLSCTELQPERTQRDEVPALHLHFVVVGRWRGRGAWAFTPKFFRDSWAEVLELYVGHPVVRDALENVQMVKKDVSAYLAKYMSKGVSMASPPRSDGTGWSLPTCWYNCSIKLRRWVLDNVRRHPRLMEALETACRDGSMDWWSYYWHSGVVEEMTGPGPHYFLGKLKGEAMRAFEQIWRAEVLDRGGGKS